MSMVFADDEMSVAEVHRIANDIFDDLTKEFDVDDWRHDAACKDGDFDTFFPVGHGPEAQRQTQEARSICGRCPVRKRCLIYSIATFQDDGIYGGLTEDERRRVRRRIRYMRSPG